MTKIICRIICCLLVYGIADAHPYPITPRPLRKLVMESQAIIIGDVIQVYRKDPDKKKKNVYSSEYTVARIVVKETLQGKVKNDTIEVPFEPNMICPAPAMYYEKTTVLAFLDVEKGKYSTHALSYGAKTLDSIGLKTYRMRIKEIRDILAMTDKPAQRNATIEWLVTCAEDPVTRWEGVFELSPASDFMSFYSANTDRFPKTDLTSAQKTRLKNALLSSVRFDYTDFGLLDLVYDDNPKEIDALLLDKLKKLEKEDYWYASDFMKRLAHLKDSAEMQNLLERQNEIELRYNNDTERKKIIDDFIAFVGG